VREVGRQQQRVVQALLRQRQAVRGQVACEAGRICGSTPPGASAGAIAGGNGRERASCSARVIGILVYALTYGTEMVASGGCTGAADAA
jgi:hypothetical protein